MSLPLPGAWIEIKELKVVKPLHTSRSLYRERGLKYEPIISQEVWNASLPLPGAWIEISSV